MRTTVKSRQTGRNPVSGCYQPVQRVNANTLRLRAVVALFRLSPSAIARATGFSRPYVARLLSRKDDFTGSPEFYRTLECKLGQIIADRTTQFFTVPATPVARARNILEQMPEQVAVEEMARAA